MDLLVSLGVNGTMFIQLASFAVVYVILKKVLFVPYYSAYLERTRKTVGQTDLAGQFLEESQRLEAQYRERATRISQQHKEIFEEARKQATVEAEQLVAKARAGARQAFDRSQSRLQEELERARQQIPMETSSVAAAIATQLVGREAAL